MILFFAVDNLQSSMASFPYSRGVDSDKEQHSTTVQYENPTSVDSIRLTQQGL